MPFSQLCASATNSEVQLIHFVANLSFLYPDLPFLERFKAAAESGFHAVELLFPYAYTPAEIQCLLQMHHLDLVLFNLPPGDTTQNEWGLLSDPYKRKEFKQAFEKALGYAILLDCHLLNVMFGQQLHTVTLADQITCAIENLIWAAPLARECGVTLLVEPLNSIDFPNYALRSTQQTVRLLQSEGLEQIKMQYDVYHSLINGEDPYQVISKQLAFIGHIQLADVPGRHQPGTGNFGFNKFFARLAEEHYQGACSLEYTPQGRTCESLAWMKEVEWW